MTPTCEDLRNKKEYKKVHSESDTSWRHGSYEFDVYHRASDNTYWGASYEKSSDGETNGLREGTADISRVYPHQKVMTVYESYPPSTEIVDRP